MPNDGLIRFWDSRVLLIGDSIQSVALDDFCCCQKRCKYALGNGTNNDGRNTEDAYYIKIEGVEIGNVPACSQCEQTDETWLVTFVFVGSNPLQCQWVVADGATQACGGGPFFGLEIIMELTENALSVYITVGNPRTTATFRHSFVGEIDMFNINLLPLNFISQPLLHACNFVNATVSVTGFSFGRP